MNTDRADKNIEPTSCSEVSGVFIRSAVQVNNHEEQNDLPSNSRLVRSSVPCILRSDSHLKERKNLKKDTGSEKAIEKSRTKQNLKELNILNNLQNTKVKDIIINERHQKELKFVFKDNIDLKIRSKNNDRSNHQQPYQHQNNETHRIFRVSSHKNTRNKKITISTKQIRQQKKSCKIKIRQYHQSLKDQFKSEFKKWCQTNTSKYVKVNK